MIGREVIGEVVAPEELSAVEGLDLFVNPPLNL
jgi:hypothetical protein